MERRSINVYIDISIRGIKATDGKIGYVLESIYPTGPLTLTQIEEVEQVTPQKAALLVAISAIQRIRGNHEIVIFTESEYLSMGFIQGWVYEWQKSNWINSKGKPVANKEEWQKLLFLLNGKSFSFQVNQPHSYREWLKKEVNKEE